MEVGSVREKIIIALLQYKFGEKNVETNISITEPEIDVIVYKFPISIKTISAKYLSGVKLIWTVDSQKSREFYNSYQPKIDMLLVHILWNEVGGFYYIPLEAQKNVFTGLGRKKYLKIPKEGTNPRGNEISNIALKELINNKLTGSIEINWIKSKIDFNPYKKWFELWKED